MVQDPGSGQVSAPLRRSIANQPPPTVLVSNDDSAWAVLRCTLRRTRSGVLLAASGGARRATPASCAVHRTLSYSAPSPDTVVCWRRFHCSASRQQAALVRL